MEEKNSPYVGGGWDMDQTSLQLPENTTKWKINLVANHYSKSDLKLLRLIWLFELIIKFYDSASNGVTLSYYDLSICESHVKKFPFFPLNKYSDSYLVRSYTACSG